MAIYAPDPKQQAQEIAAQFAQLSNGLSATEKQQWLYNAAPELAKQYGESTAKQAIEQMQQTITTPNRSISEWVRDKWNIAGAAIDGMQQPFMDFIDPNSQWAKENRAERQANLNDVSEHQQWLNMQAEHNLAQAKARGEWGIGARVENIIADPFGQTADLAAQAVPSLAIAGATYLSGGTLAPVTVPALLGTGAAQGIGGARGDLYEATMAQDDQTLQNHNAEYRTLRQNGMSEQDAKAIVGTNIRDHIGELAAAGLSSAALERFGLGKALRGQGSALRNLAGEVVSEATDEGIQTALANNMKTAINPNQSIWEDVPLAMFDGALMGGASGAVATKLSPKNITTTPVADTADQILQVAKQAQAIGLPSENTISVSKALSQQLHALGARRLNESREEWEARTANLDKQKADFEARFWQDWRNDNLQNVMNEKDTKKTSDDEKAYRAFVRSVVSPVEMNLDAYEREHNDPKIYAQKQHEKAKQELHELYRQDAIANLTQEQEGKQPETFSSPTSQSNDQNLINALIRAGVKFGDSNTKTQTNTPSALQQAAQATTAIIGGNGRTAGLKQAYTQGTAEQYRADLIANASQYGFTPEQIAEFKQPVLVRRLNNQVDVQQAAIASNEGGGLAMSTLEQAKADATRLPPLDTFTFSETGSLNTGANSRAIQQWVGQFPPNQQAALQDSNGMLSQTGEKRLQNAILYQAYGDSPTLARTIESTHQESRNIGNALAQAANTVAQAKTEIAYGNLHDLDIADDLTEAADIMEQLRAQGASISDWLAQEHLVTEIAPSPEARILVKYFNDHIRSAKAMRDLITSYYAQVQNLGNLNQADMFGDNIIPTKTDLLRKVIQNHENNTTNQSKNPSERAEQSSLIASAVQPETQSPVRTSVGQSHTESESNATVTPRNAASEIKQLFDGFAQNIVQSYQKEVQQLGTSQFNNKINELEQSYKQNNPDRANALVNELRQDISQYAKANGFKIERTGGGVGEYRWVQEQNSGSLNNGNHLRQPETTETISSNRAQYDQAKADGKTELTFAQWQQVRTPEFKAWFGDWENDPENASKVINPRTGEPLVVYHGTGTGGFNVFDTYASNYGLMGQGSYFTENREIAESYTTKNKGNNKKVYEVYLNIKNPVDMDSRVSDNYYNMVSNIVNKNTDFEMIDKNQFNSNEELMRYMEDELSQENIPDYEIHEQIYHQYIKNNIDGITHIGGGRFGNSKTKHRVFIVHDATQIKSATDNTGAFDPNNPDIRYSRTNATQAKYEQRIDELFSGHAANLHGVHVLDKSDVLDMLGYGDLPVQLDEAKVLLNQTNHPEMTANEWKKVPQWLDNPATVLLSRTHNKRMVFVPNELINGAPIYIVVEPNHNGLKIHALINSYAKDGNPQQAMRDIEKDLRNGNAVYVDKEKARELLGRSGLQLPRLPNLNTSHKKILTEKNLAGYRKNTPFDENQTRNSQSHDGTANSDRATAAKIAQYQSAIAGSLKNHAHLVNVVSREDLVRPENAEKLADVEGFYNPANDKITLIAESLRSPAHAQFVAWHELAHRKIHVSQAQEWHSAIAQAAKHETVRKLADKIQEYRKNTDDPAATNRAVAHEEAIAELYAAHETGDYAALKEKYKIPIPRVIQNNLGGFLARLGDKLASIVKRALGLNVDNHAQVYDLLRDLKNAPVSGSLNEAETRTQYSRENNNETVIEQAGKRLARIAQAIQNGAKYISNEPIYLGSTPDVLVRLGVPQRPMRIVDTKKLFQTAGSRNQDDHGLTPDVLGEFPKAMQNPLAVFDSATQENAKVLVVELKDSQERPIIAAIHVDKRQGFNQINKIASIYGRNNAEETFNRWTDDGLLRYLNDEKSHSVLTSFGLQLPTEKSMNGVRDNVLLASEFVNSDSLKFSRGQTQADVWQFVQTAQISNDPSLLQALRGDRTADYLAGKKTALGKAQDWLIEGFLKF